MYSNSDDVFSTLEGLTFEWSILPDIESKVNLGQANSIIRFTLASSHFKIKPYHYFIVVLLLFFTRFISYHDSSYEAMPHVAALERSGRRADRILVSGERSGIARVSVRPTDAALKVPLLD